MSVNTWVFYPLSSCSVLTSVLFIWSLLTSCPLRIHMWYWQKYSGSSMIFSCIIMINSHEIWVHCWWWKVMIEVWMNFSSSSLVIFFRLFLQIIIFLQYLLCCVINVYQRRWVSSWVLFIILIWSYGYSKRTEFNFCLWHEIVAWNRAELDLSVFLLEFWVRDPFLWLF